MASMGRAWKCSGEGNTGISFPLFSSGHNDFPFKPFHWAEKEPALYGGLFAKGTEIFSLPLKVSNRDLGINDTNYS